MIDGELASWISKGGKEGGSGAGEFFLSMWLSPNADKTGKQPRLPNRTVGGALIRFNENRKLVTDEVLNSEKCTEFFNKWLAPWGKTVNDLMKVINDARAVYGVNSNEPVGKDATPARRVADKNFLASMNGKNLVFFYDVELVYENSNYRNAATWIHESAHNLNVGPPGGPLVFQIDGELGQPFGKSDQWEKNSTLVTDAVMENCFPGK